MIIEEEKYFVTRLNPVNVHSHPDGPPLSLRRYSQSRIQIKTIYASFFLPVNIQPFPSPLSQPQELLGCRKASTKLLLLMIKASQ